MDHEQIGLKLHDIKPADIRAGELADLIKAFEDMIAATVAEKAPKIEKDQLGIGLVEINNQSVDLYFDTKLPELIQPAYHKITQNISTSEFLNLTDDTLDHLRIIHRFIKAASVNAEFFTSNGSTVFKATLFPDTDIPAHPRLKIHTTMYGRIFRIGGKKPKVGFETESGTLYCSVANEDLARELARHLYEWLGLMGEAELKSESLQISEFRVIGITNYRESESIRKSFTGLSEIVGDSFANIQDVDKYINSLRDNEFE
jgi:hypothetical protein